MNEKTVGIYGFGTMGSGIASAVIAHGYHVVAYDPSAEALLNGEKRIRKYLERAIKSERPEKLFSKYPPVEWPWIQKRLSDIKATLDTRIQLFQAQPDFSNCSIIIECVFEKKKIKQNVFWGLGGNKTIAQNAILASNTSSVPIHYMANVSTRPSNVIGVHFANPPYDVTGVEIIPTEHTSPETLAQTIAFAKSIGQEPIVIMKDSAGFIGNRLLAAQFIEACRIYEEAVGNEDTIQNVALKHLNFRCGPLWIADYIGLDVFLGILETLAEELPGGERFTPPVILKKLVEEGKLGRKTGQGFYPHGKKPKGGKP